MGRHSSMRSHLEIMPIGKGEGKKGKCRCVPLKCKSWAVSAQNIRNRTKRVPVWAPHGVAWQQGMRNGGWDTRGGPDTLFVPRVSFFSVLGTKRIVATGFVNHTMHFDAGRCKKSPFASYGWACRLGDLGLGKIKPLDQ